MIDMRDLKDGQELVYGKAIQGIAETAERQYVKGYEKYGVHLTSFNGRDAAKDAFEEMVDLAQYVKQLELERNAFAFLLWEVHEEDSAMTRYFAPEIMARAEIIFNKTETNIK